MGQNTGSLIVRLVRITTAPAQFAKKLIGPKACGAKILMRPRREDEQNKGGAQKEPKIQNNGGAQRAKYSGSCARETRSVVAGPKIQNTGGAQNANYWRRPKRKILAAKSAKY